MMTIENRYVDKQYIHLNNCNKTEIISAQKITQEDIMVHLLIRLIKTTKIRILNYIFQLIKKQQL